MEDSNNYDTSATDFYEEISSDDGHFDHYETLDTRYEDDNSLGLSQSDVHKLTEDLLNPMPPLDSEPTNE